MPICIKGGQFGRKKINRKISVGSTLMQITEYDIHVATIKP